MRVTRAAGVLAAVLFPVAFGLVGLACLAAYSHVAGWWLDPIDPAALAERLAPGMKWVLPEAEGPVPAMILLHGCGGRSDREDDWAERFRTMGWASLIVDSLGPRDLTGESVCAGRWLLGRERVADALIAIDEATQRPEIDASRLVLMGFSHGGWTLIEMLAMDPPQELPPGLSEAPRSGIASVAGFVLMYPYCGLVARTGAWPSKRPVLVLLGAEDEVADPAPCIAMAEGVAASGRPVEHFAYPGVGHGFDRTRPPDSDGRRATPPEAEDALARIQRFMDGLAS